MQKIKKYIIKDFLSINEKLFFSGKLKENVIEKTNKKDITYNKIFGKTVKPFFADKVSTQSKITFADNNSIFAKVEKRTKTLNTFFIKAEVSLEVPQYKPSPVSMHNAIWRTL